MRGIDRLGDRLGDAAGRAPVGPLPVGELLHPGALAAVAVLVANDWWAKRAFPGWLTGKLSDVAGLVMAPLALSAAIGCVLWLCAHAMPSIDPSARPRRFAMCIAVTAIIFASTKLSGEAAALVVRALGVFGFGASRIVVDVTDLFALPALALAALIARAELRLIARGRVHAIWRGARALDEGAFADALAAGASPTLVKELRVAVAARDVTRIDDALRQLAGASPHRQ